MDWFPSHRKKPAVKQKIISSVIDLQAHNFSNCLVKNVVPLWTLLSQGNYKDTLIKRPSNRLDKSSIPDRIEVFLDFPFFLRLWIASRRNRSKVDHSLVVDMEVKLRCKKRCNYARNSSLWRSSQQCDSRKNRLWSSRKIKRVQHRSKEFCDLGRTWRVDRDFDNTEMEK